MSDQMHDIYASRIQVWQDTEAYAHCLPPPPPSLKYRWLPRAWSRPPAGMQVSVVNMDCLEAGKQLLDRGEQTAVLNMSDNLIAGGMVSSGSGAQEESIFRRTTYCRTLHQGFYPLQYKEDGPEAGFRHCKNPSSSSSSSSYTCDSWRRAGRRQGAQQACSKVALQTSVNRCLASCKCVTIGRACSSLNISVILSGGY